MAVERENRFILHTVAELQVVITERGSYFVRHANDLIPQKSASPPVMTNDASSIISSARSRSSSDGMLITIR